MLLVCPACQQALLAGQSALYPTRAAQKIQPHDHSDCLLLGLWWSFSVSYSIPNIQPSILAFHRLARSLYQHLRFLYLVRRPHNPTIAIATSTAGLCC